MTEMFLKPIDLDLDRKIRAMLASGHTWKEIGVALGFERQGIRRFTKEEDNYIRTTFAQNRPIQEMAEHLNRDYGTICQRIFRIGLKRDGSLVRLIRKYGDIPILDGETAKEAAERIRAASETVKAQAKAAAKAANNAFIAYQLRQMNEKIAAGIDRNKAIFECRCAGIKLEAIGQFVGMTRERVRQIHAAYAVRLAIQQSISASEQRASS